MDFPIVDEYDGRGVVLPIPAAGAQGPRAWPLLEDTTMTMLRRRWFGLSAGAVAGGWLATPARAGTSAGLTFEVYADAKKEHRWRLKAANGQVIATSGQGYKAKSDCTHAIEVIQKEAGTAKIVEAPEAL